MERIFDSLSRGVIALLIAGVMLVAVSGKMAVTSVMPENDFEDLMEKEAKAGMHIKGEVKYVFDCYAYEETWTENKDGSRTPAKTSHYYYAIPGEGDNFIGLEVKVDGKTDMEALAEETYEYLSGGEEPSTKVMAEGRLSKMDDEMSGLFKEYLQEIGYTNQEIADMGEFYYIEQPASMLTAQIMFAIGVVLLILAIVIFVIRFKKRKPVTQMETAQAETLERTGTDNL